MFLLALILSYWQLWIFLLAVCLPGFIVTIRGVNLSGRSPRFWISGIAIAAIGGKFLALFTSSWTSPSGDLFRVANSVGERFLYEPAIWIAAGTVIFGGFSFAKFDGNEYFHGLAMGMFLLSIEYPYFVFA